MHVRDKKNTFHRLLCDRKCQLNRLRGSIAPAFGIRAEKVVHGPFQCVLSCLDFFIKSKGILYRSLRVEVARFYYLRHRRNAAKMNERVFFELEFHRRIGVDVNTFPRRECKDDFSGSARFQRCGFQMNITPYLPKLFTARRPGNWEQTQQK